MSIEHYLNDLAVDMMTVDVDALQALEDDPAALEEDPEVHAANPAVLAGDLQPVHVANRTVHVVDHRPVLGSDLLPVRADNQTAQSNALSALSEGLPAPEGARQATVHVENQQVLVDVTGI